MTGNCLRKQIATLMQIMNLNQEEYVNFSKFMEHTVKTHKKFYEICQDAYQTAKVGKLLTLFDQGRKAAYKGRNLDDINFSLENETIHLDNSENEDDPKSIAANENFYNRIS